MPDKATKHIPKKQQPVGATKKGKLKVRDETTGRVSWRQGKGGFSRDWDGDPVSTNYNRSGLKERPKHHAKMSYKKKGKKVYMGNRPKHEPKMGEK